MRYLLLNQTFYPDVASTAQHLSDLALALVERGHQVTVVASRRAYDHPEKLFPKEETWRGIRIIRVGSTGFGKGAKWKRAADFGSFLALCTLRLAFLPRHDAVVALTSPPLISFIGALLAKLRGSRFFYWVMDFNPDEAIAAGWLRANSLPARVLDWISRFSLRESTKVIALDRFMSERIQAKGIPADKIAVLPPWSHDDEVQFDPTGREQFRKAHGLEGKFVVMYSGNHSPVHPLDTLLKAAERLRDEKDLVFCFVGGGSEWRKIKDRVERGGGASVLRSFGGTVGKPDGGTVARGNGATVQRYDGGTVKRADGEDGGGNAEIPKHRNTETPNILCLPYQPLDQLAGSLSAGDLHSVVMGEPFVGLVHPCKIYNILSVGAPVLYVGPRPSHLSEMVERLDGKHVCHAVEHGDVEEAVEVIRRVKQQAQSLKRQVPGEVKTHFSKEAVLPKLIAVLEGNAES